MSENDNIADAILENPKNIASLLFLVASTYFLPMPLLLGVVIMLCFHWTPVPRLAVLALGIIMFTVPWATININPDFILRLNHWLFMQLVHSNWWALLDGRVLLYSFPVALLYAPVFSWALNRKFGMHHQMTRLSKGKFNSGVPYVSERRIKRALKKVTMSAVQGGALLGVNKRTGSYTYLFDTDANLHTLAIGTTGSGKTTGLCNIIESAIMRRIPLIYIDGKGDMELAQNIEKFAKLQGVPFYLFSMIGPSMKYNPIASGGITSKKDRIVELREWSEDHYRKIAEGYLQSVFSILEKCDIQTDLYTLAKYLEPDALYDLAREKNNVTLVDEIEKLEANYKNISSLIAEINNIAKSEIGNLFDCSSGEVLTLEKAFDENAIVYFCLQPLAFPSYAELMGKLVINDIKSLASLQLRKSQKQKLYTIFDEFSVFAGDQVINLINQGRGAGIHAVLSTQSLADIERKGGTALVGQVLNNCNNYLIQRQNNHSDAELLANLIGTRDSVQITSQIDGYQGATGVGTIRQTKEYIAHPDDIKRLKRGEAVFVVKQNFAVSWIQFRKGAIA